MSNSTYKLFFNLIQASIGKTKCLSRILSNSEWQQLFDLAEKHSLTGVCFAGMEVICQKEQRPDMDLLMDWLGQAEYIKTCNEEVNKQCVELQQTLTKEGFKISILKGQGIGSLYGDKLSLLRQSGDIDIFVDGGFERALSFCRKQTEDVRFDYINAHLPLFANTEVELHWRVQVLANPFANKQLQKWLIQDEVQKEIFGGTATLADGSQITVPSPTFNAFYILLHCYHHMFESGLGLRQIMDYYFVLKNRQQTASEQMFDYQELFKRFGMLRFANGMMWILQKVFALEDKYLLCKPDASEGKYLLNEIMQNGNFGHHDARKHNIHNKLLAPFATRIQHNWHLATHYPSEFFWAPIWLVYHYFWKRIKKQ